MSHVAIIVPYRDRAAHLQAFLPHMLATLEPLRAQGRLGDYSIHIIEQPPGAPFNRGKLLNCGAALTAGVADTLVLHDVDYLPIAADYTPPDRPTRLIWHGLTLREDYDSFFGAVVAFPRAHFAQANGYSNLYWGWGYEDVELRLRCVLAGLPIGHRDGTFRALPHKHNGFILPGQPTAAAQANRARCHAKVRTLAQDYRHEGLSSLRFDARPPVALAPRAWLHAVDIGQPETSTETTTMTADRTLEAGALQRHPIR